MRNIMTVLILIASSGAALAQPEPLRPAPVPNVGPAAAAPSDRLGTAGTSANAAPFSGAPGGAASGGAQPLTPSLSGPGKETGPAPAAPK